jgi:hypothetical protein
VIESNVG